MRVCVISSIFPPYTRGGAEMVADASAQAFSNNHDVFVITCSPWQGWGSFAGGWKQEGAMRVFRFTPFNLFTIFSLSKYPALLRMIWHILDMINLHTYLVVRRILLEQQPDLVLTHNLKGLGYTVHLAIHHSKFVKKQAMWFHTIHDLAALHPTGLRIWGKEKSVMQENFLVRCYAWVNKKLLGDPNLVISPSQFLLNEYKARKFFPASKTVVVCNPVSPMTLNKRGGNCFLYLGQLEPYKGLQLLLNVWKNFVAQNPDARLEIAGQGSMQDEIKRLEKEIRGVKYHGFVPHDQIASVLQGARFVVMPSLAYETFGLVIAESFSAGVPVIASQIGAIPELVQDGVNGFLFQPGDNNALRAAFDRAMQSPWPKLSANAKQSAEKCTLVQYGAKLQELYNSLTKK